MNRHFKYKKLILIIAIFLFLFSLYTIRQTNELNKISSSNSTHSSESVEAFSVSDSDIEEAKMVVEDYFKTLKTRETVILKDFLGYNMINLGGIGACNVNSDNSSLGFLYDDSFKPELIKIDTSPKHSFDASYYAGEIKNQNNIDVFKIVNLHVYFNYLKKRDWDFILVKYTENSPWKIHLWIE